MKIKLSKTILIAFMLMTSSQIAFAAKKSKNFKKIENKLYLSKKKIKSLKNKINHLENELNKNNDSLLEVMDKRKKFGQTFDEMREVALKNQERLEKQRIQKKKALNLVILGQMNSETSSNLLGQKIVTKHLKSVILEIETKQKENQILINKLRFLESQLNELGQTERTLLGLQKELDQRKSGWVEEYLSSVKKHDKLKGQFTALSKKKLREAKKKALKFSNKGTFSIPINKFNGIDNQKKGVLFSFTETQNLRAPKAGTVVYVGKLSVYGNIIMIDHPNGERSVMLGDIRSDLKKGRKVKAHQVIGKAVAQNRKSSKVYFEVRLNNKPVDTLKKIRSKQLASYFNKLEKKI